MKKLFVLVSVLLAAFLAPAQSTNVLTHTDQVNSDLLKFGSDLWGAFVTMRPFTTNRTVLVQIGGGENTASKEAIEAAFITVPTSEHTAIGFGGYHIGSEWADANVNLTFGVTNTVPLLGAVRSFAGDGLAWNFQKREAANFVYTGEDKQWLFGKWDVGIGYAIANTSDRTGIDIIGGVHIQFSW